MPNPHSALHARCQGKRKKGRPRMRRIDNLNDSRPITCLGLSVRGTMDQGKLTKKGTGDNLFPPRPISAKWLASGYDDDDKL